MGNSHSHSTHPLYFGGINNLPVPLKPLFVVIATFDQEQQSSEGPFSLAEEVLDLLLPYAWAPSPADARIIKERALSRCRSRET